MSNTDRPDLSSFEAFATWMTAQLDASLRGEARSLHHTLYDLLRELEADRELPTPSNPVDLDRLEALARAIVVDSLRADVLAAIHELRALRALRDAVADYQGRAYEHDDDIADLIDRARALREGREL